MGDERIKSPSFMAISCKRLHVYFPENKMTYEVSPNGTGEPSLVTIVCITVFQKAYKMNQLNFKVEVTALLKKSKCPKRGKKKAWKIDNTSHYNTSLSSKFYTNNVHTIPYNIKIKMYRTGNWLLFCVGVKLGLSHGEKNTGLGFLRIGC